MEKIKKYLSIKNLFFIVLTSLLIIYILFIKTKLYESYVNVVVKNLNSQAASINGLAFLIPENSSNQDVFILENYLKSYEELKKLDKNFNLKKHYSSDNVDIIERLKPWSTKEDFLNLYQKRLEFVYDPTTGIITLGFLHTDPKIAYEILNQLIKDANERINFYNKEIAKKQLEFAKKQVEKTKKALEESIKKLLEFQNAHSLLNPEMTAQSKFALAAKLESELIAKKAELNNLLQYMNESSFEVKRLKNEIYLTEKTLKKIKKSLASPKKKALNLYIFEFERLKEMSAFNRELYKQALLEYEKLKMEINKNSKTLLTLTKPYLPQSYKYPEILKDIITIILIMVLLYGIISLIQAIIKEHID